MSDSDAEFEKFLQQSLSSSGASYLSELSRSGKLKSGGGSPSPPHQPWWMKGDSEVAVGDHDLEATGHSWLKSTTQSQRAVEGPAAASLQITMPTTGIEEYSKDSLDVSKSHSNTLSVKSNNIMSNSEESDFSSLDKSSSRSLDHSARFSSTQPGLDTLEENADKRRFFDELEQDRDTPLDYSELNRELGETGKSSLLDTISPTFDYDDDFDSETVHEDTSSSSTHSVTPTTSLREDSNPSNTAETVTATASKYYKPLSNSSAAIDKVQPQTSTLLTRSSNKQHSFLQYDSANAKTMGIRSPESTEFKLSPIRTRTAHTGPGVANRSVISDENSSILSSESASSTSEAKGITLTPLHAKQLTASDLFKSTPVDKTKTVSEGKQATTTLSPLHAAGNGVLKQSTSDPQSPEWKPLATDNGPLAIGLSPVHTKLSSSHGRQLKVTEHSSLMHKQKDFDNSLLLQQGADDKDTRPDVPKESTIPRPEDDLELIPDQPPSIEQSIGVQSKSQPEDTPIASPTKPLLGVDKSGLGDDLAELQSALQAAGLPPMRMTDEEKPQKEPVQSPQSPKECPLVDASTKDTQSSAAGDTKPEPLASFAGDHSEPNKQVSVKVSGKPKIPGAMKFDLREAIHAIAREELTTISKEILKQDLRQKHSDTSQSQQPLLLNRETTSASNGKKSEHNTESLLPDGNEPSHSTYEELEKLSDLLADIENSEGQESTANYKDSKKLSLSSSRKPASALPKTSVKVVASKKGPASKVDTRLSSKVKTGIRPSSTSRSSVKDYKIGSRLAELAAPKKINKTPSATSIRTQAKPKTQSQSFRPSSSKSAPPKQLSTGRTSLKQYSGTAAKSVSQPSNSRRHQIVIPTGSSSALESQSDSEDEVIQAAHEGGKETVSVGRPEIKMDAWKKALQDEKEGSENLSLQLTQKEREFEEKEQQLRQTHREEVNQLRQEIVTLSIKLKDAESAKNPRQLLAQGRGAGLSISEEEKSTLEKDIKEQEVLLLGYQKENERLYAELSRYQKESKAEQSLLFRENQRLASEVLNTRTQLEKQLLSAGSQGETTPTDSTHFEAARISQLEDKLERSNSTCKDLQNQVKQLKHSNQSFEQDAKAARLQVRQLEDKMRTMVDRDQLQQLKKNHQEEISSLNRKLEWYAENQRLLDKDYELLHSKEEEIASLKEKLASLEGEGKQKSVRSRAAEARRVQQLEHQVKELKNIIKKRFPNSLSALILSSGVAEGPSKTSDKAATPVGVATTKSAPPTRAFLEKRVQQLENLLESKDKECARKLRALQQKCTALEVTYEKQLASLKEQVTSTAAADDGMKMKKRFDKELAQLRSELERTQHENHQLREAMEKYRREAGSSDERSASGRDEALVNFKTSLEADSLRTENHQLKEKLSELNFEMAHQHVQLQGKVAETESRAALMRETMQEKIQKLESEHKTQLDSLIAKYAREHSKSETTRLKSQLAAREATIVNLREKLECAEFDIKKLVTDREREERLKEQVKVLTEQLLEAKRHHTPEMHHFMALQTKIATLEQKCTEYELSAKRQLHALSQPSEKVEEKVKEVEQKWRRQLLAKNSEIEQFREELDSLLSAMQVLKRGV